MTPWTLRAALVLAGAAAALGAQEPPRNRLAGSSSPYLREHAEDPVHWHAWGDEALARARREKKPIFLSIGYSACHWCHVMQRESFQNEGIAAILNRAFVCIKVDREERPDVDRVYIEACQRMSPEGCGWPLTAFLTPDREPFFIATYLPPADAGGRRGFRGVCEQIEKLWAEEEADVRERARKITGYLREAQAGASSSELPERELAVLAADALLANEDRQHGGFGEAPKFPIPSTSLLLLRVAARDRRDDAAQAVRRQVEAFARGGLRDHLAGGFHRYSTDRAWIVPHFEKMLYDQALISRVCLEAGQSLGEPRFLALAREGIAFVLAEMATSGGAFIAALDADTGGVEGATYLWTKDEIAKLLGKDELAVFSSWCGLEAPPDLEGGLYVIREARPPADVASATMKPAAAVEEMLRGAKAKLLAARQRRAQPRKDDKVLLGWNALMISTLARASGPLGDRTILERALRAAAMIEKDLVLRDGRFLRCRGGEGGHPLAELSDVAALLEAWLDLHEATLDRSWLDKAHGVADAMLKTFGKEGGRLVDSAAADILFETQEVWDGPWPSGISLAALGLARLGILREDASRLDAAAAVLRCVGRVVARRPSGSPHALIALDLLTAPAARVALEGPLDDGPGRALVLSLDRGYRPFVLRTRADPAAAGPVPPRAIVCVKTRCLAPAATPEELEARLAESLRQETSSDPPR